MSFYDEFLKSLEEDSENLESATEGLEAEETPVEEPEAAAEEKTDELVPEDNAENAVVDEEPEVPTEDVSNEDAMESISDLFLLEVGVVTDQFTEGEISEESYIEQIDTLCKEYGAYESGCGKKKCKSKGKECDDVDEDCDNEEGCESKCKKTKGCESGCKAKVKALESFEDLCSNIPELAFALENFMAENLPESVAEEKTDELVPEVEPEVTEPVAEEKIEEATETEEKTAEPVEAAEESAIREVSDEEILTTGMESILFLEALRATCSSEDEYKTILSENATELQLYGVVDPVAIARESYEDEDESEEDIATEAKNIVRLNKQARISTEVARISIGLAKKANDPLYKYYHKYSVLKRQFRDKIYAKYGPRANPLARKAVANGRNRAAMINSPAGAGIVSKIDSRLKQLDKAARNMSAIKKDVTPSKPAMGKKK